MVGIKGTVLVNGVGFDVRDKYTCIFKVVELGDGTSFRGRNVAPVDGKAIDCGKLPDVHGESNANPIIHVYAAIVKVSSTSTGHSNTHALLQLWCKPKGARQFHTY